MKFIKPNLISGEIMNLLDEAEKMVILICPYYKIGKWFKLQKKISELKLKKIIPEFYVRAGEIESIAEIEAIGFKPYEIANLHCKIYINESYAIVSSMNLLLTSEINSLDIAYKTTSKEEYDEILEFYKRYFNKNQNEKELLLESTTINYAEKLIVVLHEVLKVNQVEIKNIYIHKESLLIKSDSGTYRMYVTNQNLEMIATVSSEELLSAINSPAVFVDTDVQLIPIDKINSEPPKLLGRYNKKLISTSITSIDQSEVLLFYNKIAQFVYSTENLRSILDSAKAY